MIVFNCQKCGKEFKSKDACEGMKFTCTKCGKEGRIPTPQELKRPLAIAEADPVPVNAQPAEIPPLKKSVRSSAKTLEEPNEELSAPKEEPAKDHPGVESKTPILAGKPLIHARILGQILSLVALGFTLLFVMGIVKLLASDYHPFLSIFPWKASPLFLFPAIVCFYFSFRLLQKTDSQSFEKLFHDDLATLEAKNEKRLASQTLELCGLQGKMVSVDGATIKMIKKGWGFATQREKALPIRNISSVEVKMPGAVMSGFIQFSIAGGAARNSSFTWTGGTFDAAQDENSVVFVGQNAYQIALKIKEYIETYQERASSSGSPVSAADEIVKLKALMDQGIITPEEFAIKKRRFIES